MVVPLIFSSLSKPPLKCGGHTIRLGGSHNNQVASFTAACNLAIWKRYRLSLLGGAFEAVSFPFGICIKRCKYPVRRSSYGENL